MRVFVFNSGLFYMRPTPAALDLLDRLVLRVETENGWDQAIFNEVTSFSFIKICKISSIYFIPLGDLTSFHKARPTQDILSGNTT